MKANLQDQQTLLKLSEIDFAISRLKKTIKDTEASEAVNNAREDLLATSEELINARARVGDLELELKRSENDLELVESRLKRDEARLAEAKNQKDAEGLQHEIESLRTRKSQLEDAELFVLESLEGAKAAVSNYEEQKEAKELVFKSIQQGLESELENLRLEFEQTGIRRQQTASTLDPALLTAYQRKLERGSAIGRLVGRDCGSCRLSITATSFDEISSLPVDELAECPSCGAFLVRS
ncbi:MAG: zinc ribbon domain-containing protein [Actinomycetota bacterium]